MKAFKYVLSSIVFLVAFKLMAQPLPPTNPDGTPVPLGDLVILVLLVGTLLVWKKKKKT